MLQSSIWCDIWQPVNTCVRDIPLTEPDLHGHECCQVRILHTSAMPFLRYNSKFSNPNRTVLQIQRYTLARMLIRAKLTSLSCNYQRLVSMNYRIVRGYLREIEVQCIEPPYGRTLIERGDSWSETSVRGLIFPDLIARRREGSHWLVINDIESVNYICVPSCNGLQTSVKFHYQPFNITLCFHFRKK
jgi:hypothetical protein